MIEAMKQALEALTFRVSPDKELEAIAALRQAIEQAEQQEFVDIHCPSCLHYFAVVPVAKREWVGLTDYEIDDVASESGFGYINVARAVEAKLKELNNHD